MAGAGIASRRKADELIQLGQVQINGKTVTDLGVKVELGRDRVEYMGKLVEPTTESLLFMFNKPVGVTSTMADVHAEKTIADYFKKFGRIYPVGRLDKNSEGLILVTNNGDLANKLTHPKYEHEKEYEVVISSRLGKSDEGDLEKEFSKRFVLDGYKIKPMQAKSVKIISSHKWLVTLVLQEGRKRQIRRIAEMLGYKVVQLKRVRIGKLNLGNLPNGKYKEVNETDII